MMSESSIPWRFGTGSPQQVQANSSDIVALGSEVGLKGCKIDKGIHVFCYDMNPGSHKAERCGLSASLSHDLGDEQGL